MVNCESTGQNENDSTLKKLPAWDESEMKRGWNMCFIFRLFRGRILLMCNILPLFMGNILWWCNILRIFRGNILLLCVICFLFNGRIFRCDFILLVNRWSIKRWKNIWPDGNLVVSLHKIPWRWRELGLTDGTATWNGGSRGRRGGCWVSRSLRVQASTTPRLSNCSTIVRRTTLTLPAGTRSCRSPLVTRKATSDLPCVWCRTIDAFPSRLHRQRMQVYVFRVQNGMQNVPFSPSVSTTVEPTTRISFQSPSYPDWDVMSMKSYQVSDGARRTTWTSFLQKESLTIYDCDGKEDLDLTIMIAVLGTAAQLERENIVFRLQSGRKRYVEKNIALTGKSGLGREGYRKPKDQKAEEYKETLKLLRKGYPYRKVAKLTNVSESTVKRLKKEFEIWKRQPDIKIWDLMGRGEFGQKWLSVL